MAYVLVFIGSGIGGVLRYAVGVMALRLWGAGFPFGTLAINIIGSALMGLVAGLFAALGGGQDLRLFLTTGIIGGFTTFSTFSLDVAALWERQHYAAAVLYVVLSVGVSLAALMSVLALARRWI